VVELNRAAAVAMANGPARGLELMERLSPALGEYRWYHAARADLLRRLSRREEAVIAYQRALEMAANQSERAYLQRRLAEVATR
jgi:RNA polymerase sigma-70 factor (ECF subfamily)